NAKVIGSIPVWASVIFSFFFQWSWYVAKVTEVPGLALVPNSILQRVILKPFRYQVAGTVLVSFLSYCTRDNIMVFSNFILNSWSPKHLALLFVVSDPGLG